VHYIVQREERRRKTRVKYTESSGISSGMPVTHFATVATRACHLSHK